MNPKKEKRMQKQFLRLMKKLYPWWDYTNFYKLMADWLTHTAKQEFNCEGSEELRKEFLEAAELCTFISMDYCPSDARIITPEEKLKSIEKLGKLLLENSLGWWD